MRLRAGRACVGVLLAAAVGGWASAGVAPAGEGRPPTLTLEALAGMSWSELEQLYRQADAGPLPTGYARGRAVYCPDDFLAGPRSRGTRLLWKGKDFRCDGTLVNQWFAFRAIRARVGYGPSWIDGRPSVVMDYSGTSRVWADVRDEAREVAPGLYLGAMFKRGCPQATFKMFFVLEVTPQGGCCEREVGAP
jgi:hypothetical protein